MDNKKLVWTVVTSLLIISLIGGYIYITPQQFVIKLKNNQTLAEYKEGTFTLKSGRTIVLRSNYNIECLDHGRYKRVNRVSPNKFSNLSFAKFGKYYTLKQEIHHSKGTLIRYFDILDSDNISVKESFAWLPENQNEKCRIRIKYTNIKKDFDREQLYPRNNKTNVSVSKNFIIDWSNDKEKITSVWTFKNNNIQILSKPIKGAFTFDPLITTEPANHENKILKKRKFLLTKVPEKISINKIRPNSSLRDIDKKINLHCKGADIKTIENWSFVIENNQYSDGCFVHINVSDKKYMDNFNIKLVSSLYNKSFKKIRYFVPVIENNIKKGKEVKKEDIISKKPNEFLIEFVPEPGWKKIEYGLSFGEEPKAFNLNQNYYESDFIYIDPGLYNDDGLVLYYSFDNGSAYDLSGNGHDGTLFNGLVIDDAYGKYGKGAKFDGFNDFIVVDGDVDLPQFTICAWVYRKSDDDIHPIVSKLYYHDLEHYSYNYELNLRTNDKVQLTTDSSNYSQGKLTSAETIPLNEWHHICGVGGSNGRKIYIDGELDSSDSVSEIVLNDAPTTIGKTNTFSYYFDGYLDEIKIWNRTLSDGEILEEYLHTNESSGGPVNPNNTKIIFVVPADFTQGSSLVCSLQFEGPYNITTEDTGTVPSTTIHPVDYRTSVLLRNYDLIHDTYYSRIAKNDLGVVSLPKLYNRTFMLPFKINFNRSFSAGEEACVTLNITDAMVKRNIQSPFYGNSIQVFCHNIFGGLKYELNFTISS